MKNTLQKILCCILIAVGLIFGIVLAIISVTIIRNVDSLGGVFTNDRIGFTLLLVLGIIYVGLSVYLVISMTQGKVPLKTVLLNSDNVSAVTTTNKVIRKMIKACVNSLNGAKLVSVAVKEADKPGFNLYVKIKLTDGNLNSQTQKLRFVIEDSFKKELDFAFNGIDIKVVSLNNGFAPDIQRAEKHVADKQKEDEAKAEIKIAQPTPAEQTVIENNLTPEEIASIDRLDDLNQAQSDDNDGVDAQPENQTDTEIETERQSTEQYDNFNATISDADEEVEQHVSDETEE